MKRTDRSIRLIIGAAAMSALLLCAVSCTKKNGQETGTTAGAVTTAPDTTVVTTTTPTTTAPNTTETTTAPSGSDTNGTDSSVTGTTEGTTPADSITRGRFMR